MRALINYFRQWLCKHDFMIIKEVHVHSDEGFDMPIGCYRIYRCQKCGYTQRIKII